MWQIFKNWVFNLSFVTRVVELDLSLRDAKGLIPVLIEANVGDSMELRHDDDKLIIRINIKKDGDAKIDIR